MTDHKPLKHLFTSETRNPRIQRWAIILAEYGCDSKNVVADALSRLGQLGEDEVMTRESSAVGPANYACRREEGGDYQRHVCSVCGNSSEVNVIDSDRAPAVQLESKVESCGE